MRTKNGFTLLEILISMSLFTLIGVAVVVLMRSGVDMWLSGTEGSRQEDRLEQSLPRLEEDLRHVLVPFQRDRIPFDPKNPDPKEEPDALPPENRFLSAYHVFKRRDQEVRCRYLAFVRDIVNLTEVETYAARAGTNPEASAYIDGKNDEAEFKDNLHLPTGGSCEVLWIWLPDDEEIGLGTVYRVYRSPIGGKGTLLDPKNHDEMEEIKALNPQPMFQRVTLFDLLFWTQYTTHWTWAPNEPVIRETPREPSDVRSGRRECGPARTWDSTRGMLKSDDPLRGFALGRGEGSFNRSNDDIWPRAVRVEFSLAEQETELARPIGADATEFTLVVSDFATGQGELFNRPMKIGTEWLRIDQRDASRRDTFRIRERGVRGTKKIAHAEGEPVYFGRVFDFTISIPAFRDDNN